MFNSVRLIIDDTNSTLLYAGAWFTAGNGSPAFNSTTHGTKAPRSTTTFKFNGTRQAISKINAGSLICH
ncbi:hypothetical protein NEOLEDRAFT_400237 [Neolentinus lepideus HHB14362 ss-1]|uniref:Uncharacterized protein n=1 Tax=Neolentinus lepideus HHB14362 ss-1 TaxID=1314782 RepID=A0A165SAB9_9AGAM|nr:hypothetical protein NEOLEDRAFT_400237 [Neolentinus lepideus HHB14362 ss-1]